MTRTYDGLVEALPNPRHSIRDDHHLLWASADMRQLGLGPVIALHCVRDRNADSMMHSIVHQLYGGIRRPPEGPLRREFIGRATTCLRRHRGRRCSCYRPQQAVSINAFTLESARRSDQLPPCIIQNVDPYVVELMRDNYLRLADCSQAVYELLERRHASDQCGCKRLRLALAA